METTVKGILIGGSALRELGSTRYTEDRDFLINDPTQKGLFIHVEGGQVDYINAGASQGNRSAIAFFKDIYAAEQKHIGATASPQSLLELKAFSLVQHCLNGNWKKADEAEFDMKFLVRTFRLKGVKIVKKYVSAGELTEINRIIKQVTDRQ